MSINLETFGIDKLSVAERLELIELIWDSVEQLPPEAIPERHLDLLAERLSHPGLSPGKPWREFLAEFQQPK